MNNILTLVIAIYFNCICYIMNTKQQHNNLVDLNIIGDKIERLPKRILNNISEYGYSDVKNKKYYVIYDNKKINFGDIRYQDYLIHKDLKRKKNYRTRHINDDYNNPYKPSFYSWFILW